MIDVTLKVDEARLAEFYAMYAHWLETSTPAATAPDGELKLNGWGLGDEDQARHVWSRMSPQARHLFQLLPAAPDSVPWGDLANALGPDADATTVGGTLGWPARFAKEVGRTRPTRAGETPQGTVYWLEPEVKALFDKVAAEFE